MAQAKIFTATAFARSGISFRNRVLHWDETPILQSEITSIAYDVRREDAPTSIVASGTLSAGSVVFNTYQSWDVDDTGFNFKWDAPATIFPTANKFYWVDITFTPTSGAKFPVIWKVHVLQRLST